MITQSRIGNKLDGFFTGVVLKHCPILSSDVESGYGKCKVWVAGVYPEELNNTLRADEIPDALQISPLFAGSCDGNGLYSYPNIGSTVVCGFINGDQNFPFFFGSILGGSHAKNAYKFVNSLQGTLSCVENGTDARIHSIRSGNSTINIYESGLIDINVIGSNSGNSHVFIDGSGNIKIDSSQQIDLHASNIVLRADKQIEMHANDILLDAIDKVDVESTKLIKLNTAISITQNANAITINGKHGTVIGNKHKTNFI